MIDWRSLTPSEVLDRWNCLDIDKVAYVLDLCHKRGAARGTPDPKQVIELVRQGRLHLVDPDVPRFYWTVSASEVRRYMDAKVRRSIGRAS